MPTVGEVFAQVAALLGSVPRAAESFVCKDCLGPVNLGFARCFGCARLLGGYDSPHPVEQRVVPMTTALSPSPWYTRLATYKVGNPEYRLLIGAVAYTYLTTNARRLAELLGGEPTLLTIVPSKRGVAYEDQPLRKALSVVAPIRERLAPTLRFSLGAPCGRHQYHPESFARGAVPVEGQRVALIEDTWVTGATAISAAGALLEHGAAAVAVLPLARCIDSGFWPAGHPYRGAMARGYEPAGWPR